MMIKKPIFSQTSHALYISIFQEEHEAILKNREIADSGITWKEYKSMTFTFQVVQLFCKQFNIISVAFFDN